MSIVSPANFYYILALMKQCPSCRTTYTDPTLSFCLADGTPLIDVAEEPTVSRSGRGEPMRVEIGQEVTKQPFMPNPAPPAAPTGSNTMKIVLVVGLLAGMMLIGVIGAGALIYFNRDARPIANENRNSNNIVKPSPTVEPTVDQSNTLRDQIANLEKRLNEQKKGTPGPIAPFPPINPTTMTTPAKANSPGDGFLALRSLPNSEAGDRIAKIPHGATVMIGGCGPVIKPVNRSGRWCQASYNGKTGWVFDGYLTY